MTSLTPLLWRHLPLYYDFTNFYKVHNIEHYMEEQNCVLFDVVAKFYIANFDFVTAIVQLYNPLVSSYYDVTDPSTMLSLTPLLWRHYSSFIPFLTPLLWRH